MRSCKVGFRMKKAYFVIAVVMLITCLTGIPDLVSGINARGWHEVNYGSAIFPCCLATLSFG